MIIFRKFVYDHGIFIAILLVIISAAILRYSARNSFKPDAFKHAKSSLAGKNIISPADIPGLEGKKLVIRLDDAGMIIPYVDDLISSPGEIFSKENLRLIKRTDGPVLLLSDDPSVSARAWMLLAQKGFDNIYIISEEWDEIPKNEFRPDTLVRPELLKY